MNSHDLSFTLFAVHVCLTWYQSGYVHNLLNLLWATCFCVACVNLRIYYKLVVYVRWWWHIYFEDRLYAGVYVRWTDNLWCSDNMCVDPLRQVPCVCIFCAEWVLKTVKYALSMMRWIILKAVNALWIPWRKMCILEFECSLCPWNLFISFVKICQVFNHCSNL